jgi:hypothetical protein
MLPTPLHEWRLPGLPEGVRLLVKRDDLTGMQLSGNKVGGALGSGRWVEECKGSWGGEG